MGPSHLKAALNALMVSQMAVYINVIPEVGALGFLIMTVGRQRPFSTSRSSIAMSVYGAMPVVASIHI